MAVLDEIAADLLHRQAIADPPGSPPKEDSPEKGSLPTTRQADSLPFLLKKGMAQFRENYEKELFLFSALTVSSGLLTKVKGVYHQKEVFPNLFLLAIAPPASGKGVMMYARELISKIHEEKLKESLKLKAEYLKRGRQPDKSTTQTVLERPLFNVVLIPADNSCSKLISHLSDNQAGDCPAVLIESEIDTLSKAQKNDWGNFSDILRKAFHNERVSLSRKTNDEYVEVSSPKLAVALSGTLNQLRGLINNSEDGLYSRFLIITIEGGSKWSDVSPCDACPNLTEIFSEQATEYYDFWEYISKEHLEVLLTQKQWDIINKRFGDNLREISEYVNPHCGSLVKRHGIMLYKMCMVLTAFRKFEEKVTSKRMVCRPEDFDTALYLIERSLDRSLELFDRLPGASKQLPDTSNKIIERLPTLFSYTQAMAVGKALNISDRTVERHLKSLVKDGSLIKLDKGKYQKKHGVGMTDDGCNI